MFGHKTLLILSLSIILSLSRSQTYFECTFKDNDCGIKNEPDMKTLFTYGRAFIGGRDQNMMHLDVSSAQTQGARLVTPYYHSYDQIYGCLTVQWYSYGAGQQSLSITQQDKRNVKIWSSYVKSYDWQKTAINVDLRGGDLRFFIEANFEPKTKGMIAIDDLRLDYHKC